MDVARQQPPPHPASPPPRAERRPIRATAFAALGCLALLAVPHAVAAADLTVTVEGIRNDHGRVYVTLFNSASTWLDGDHSLQDQSIPAHPGPVSVTFHNVRARSLRSCNLP
ncbi:MAG: DUF2141 domain-containing protein [Aliidongia sp.]